MATAKQETQTVEVYFGEKAFSADDLTIGDIAEMEEEFGEPIEDIDFNRKKAIMWLVWLVRRSSEPELTLEDVGNTKIRDLMAESGDDGSRPTEEPAADSPSAKGGSRGSRATTASRRGTSRS
jgi:hypothetical protein